MKRSLRYEGRIQKNLKRLEPEPRTRILLAMERLAAIGEGDVRGFLPSSRGQVEGVLPPGRDRVVFYQIDNRGKS